MRQLLAIAIGPVQEFIAAARRTRDLWFGSWLLSELSRKAAEAVQATGGQLIFPADVDQPSVANIVLAELNGQDPAEVARKAKQAALGFWKDQAEAAYRCVQPVLRDDIWQAQVDDVLEWYAAWVPLEGSYQTARARLMRLLAGRKNCRDFLPAQGFARVPKSSLDGLRESVLKHPDDPAWGQPAVHRALRVRWGEQLDVVGVVKRVGKGKQPYPSVARVAADPWVRGNQHKAAFKELRAALDDLHRRYPEAVHRLDVNIYPQYSALPYEGTAVYPSRHREWIEEVQDFDEPELKPLRDALAKLPEPLPYLAVLVADGDRMGELISRLQTPDQNRRFSRTLAAFSGRVAELLRAHAGFAVYAGGDDVLAFVPVDKCLACARALHDAFDRCLGEFARDVGLGTAPTLSVGIAIGHFLEDMEDLLVYGRAAERDAKEPDRNGLAVHLRKRGGEPIAARWRWDEQPHDLLTHYARLHLKNALPYGFARELRELCRLYSRWPDRSRALEALKADARRLVRAKTPAAGKAALGEVATILEGFASIEAFDRFGRALLIAQQIAAAAKQSGEQLNEEQGEAG